MPRRPRSKFPAHVPVSVREVRAERARRLHAKEDPAARPIKVTGRLIARSAWGRAWCKNLEIYSDFANRLPRGRTYLRAGSVIDLRSQGPKVTAKVMGSELYDVEIAIAPLAPARWAEIRRAAAGAIDSLVALLAGDLPPALMSFVSAPATGLFPSPKEIEFACSCPDRARLCKHVAAALYGVGARLDHEPSLLFALRGVDPRELTPDADLIAGTAPEHRLDANLSTLFGIAIDET